MKLNNTRQDFYGVNQVAPVKLIKILSWLCGVIICLLPFHAFLTVWLSSLVGHYTLLRLWKEFLLVPLIAYSVYRLIADQKLRAKLLDDWLVRLIFAYTFLIIASGLIALSLSDVTAKAMFYGILVDLRFLGFFLAVLIISSKNIWLSQNWHRILFGPASLVASFAILQFWVLPYDFLKHFGYGQSTIYPYETINHNLHHIRVASTLRGANPLGAYLILPISAIAVLLFKSKRQRYNKFVIASGLSLALIFSFSRSAWIGALLGVFIAAWLSVKSPRLKKNIGLAAAGTVAAAAILTVVLWNNLNFQNAVFHTDNKSKIAVSSNEGHSAAAKAAVKDVFHHPLGSGVGTAGPQSVYSNGKTKIAENYYLQIGQETGLAGMVLLIAIITLAGKNLYDGRTDPLALALFASLIGLSIVNLLSHAWADDTLAYIWWGLAGIACASAIITDKHKQKNGNKIT